MLKFCRSSATSFEFQKEKSRKCSSFARLLKKPFEATLNLESKNETSLIFYKTLEAVLVCNG
jgi:hypothetical protein